MWAPIECSPECLEVWRAEQRAASSRKYWHSLKGCKATRLRVSAWRAEKRRTIVTHAAAQKVDFSTIVALRDPAPSAVEAVTATVTLEETSHEEDREGDLGCVEAAVPDETQDAEDEQGGRRGVGDTLGVLGPRAGSERSVAVRAEPVGPHCARCGRKGVEVAGSVVVQSVRPARPARPAKRTRSASCPMTSASEAATLRPIATIGTVLGRARCRQPARIERMKQSLAMHGQMTPLVTTARPEGVELVDGFKRLAAAEALGWPSVSIIVRPMDEMAQWTAMLLLNRGPVSMTTLEEALVLRELCKTGLTQTEVAALCARHKTWVSRRVGLVDRLHPELVEAMKLGLLHPGSARRLLSLPPGNQLEVSAAVQSAGLGPRDTELLVGLWRRTKEPQARRALLSEPRASLRRHHPETRRWPLDPRLSPEGQRLCRSLRRFETAATETSRRLCSASAATDRTVLAEELQKAEEAASRLLTELGSARTGAGADASGGSGATS
jgi:ParB-like chromosome segregation protein Spo0J